MAKIKQIYKKYKVPANLQLHMYRVTAVAQVIADNFEDKLEKHELVIACLFHDIGNIIKFDLKLFPKFLRPEGYDYWKNVQDEFIMKYGEDEHEATFKIAKEVGISERAYEILTAVGFAQAEEIHKQEDFNKKIILYSDQRVGLNGIISMQERHEEGRERYLKRRNKNVGDDSLENFMKLASFMEQIESQVFDKCKIKPEEIADELIQPIIERLNDRGI